VAAPVIAALGLGDAGALPQFCRSRLISGKGDVSFLETHI
jgi:hypothetical protein